MKHFSFLPVIFLFLSCGSNNTHESHTEPSASSSARNQAAAETPAAEKTETYCNQRFAFCISYDRELLDAQPEADSRDGRIFLDKSGSEFLRVYGRLNSDPDIGIVTMDEALEERYGKFLTNAGDDSKSAATSIYKKSGKDFVVFTAARNDTIYYTKIIKAGGDLAFADFRYLAKDKATYDAVITRMAGSFKPADNGH